MPDNPLQFVLAFAQAVTYKLQSTNARIPVLPAGRQFNTEYIYNGTVPAGGLSLDQALNSPYGSGPLNIDGAGKQLYSLLGEYTIINLDTTHSLDVFVHGVLKVTLSANGGGFNEQDREILPVIIRLVPHTAGTTVVTFVNAWGYGAST